MNTEKRRIPEVTRDRMLTMVDSNAMRTFLMERGDFDINHWIDLVVNAPRPMDLKLELLRELRSVDMEREDLDRLNRIIRLGETAINKLYHMDSEKSVILLQYYDTYLPDPIDAGVVPCRSYEAVSDKIRYDFCLEEKEMELENQSDFQNYYIVLELYDIVNGKYKKYAEYFCTPNGKVNYIRIGSEMDQLHDTDSVLPIFDEAGGNRTVPWYQVGDILYVDMRPWYRPTICLVYWAPGANATDNCGAQCLYPTVGGLIGDGSLKRGDFLPHFELLNEKRPFFSPLFRAEPYSGILPKEYVFMESLSEQLKRNPELSERLNIFMRKKAEESCTCKLVTYRPTVLEQFEGSYNGGNDETIDVIWHPDGRKKEQGEDYGNIYGTTKSQLFEFMGIEKSKGDDGHVS